MVRFFLGLGGGADHGCAGDGRFALCFHSRVSVVNQFVGGLPGLVFVVPYNQVSADAQAWSAARICEFFTHSIETSS